MGGIVSTVTSAVTSVVKATVSVAGAVVEAASPVTKIAASVLKSTLDNTLGKVLPASIYNKISSFTNAGAAIAEGHFKPENFRAVVKGMMDIALIGNRIAAEGLMQAQKVGIVKSIDQFSGGLITSVQHLNKVPITLETGGKVDWKTTLIDAIKVYAAIMSGGLAVGVMTASNATGEATGLNKTSLGQGVLSAGAMMATGTASFSQVATSGATQVGTKAVLNNTSLGQTELGRTAVSIGVVASVNSVQANTAFSDEMRNQAESKINEIAKKKANEELQKQTGLPINVNMVTDAYDFVQSDKTIEEVLSEAQDKYTKKYEELSTKVENFSVGETIDAAGNKVTRTIDQAGNKIITTIDKIGNSYEEILDDAANMTAEEIADKAAREADSYVLSQLENAKNKYGQKMFDYLLTKYGPRMDYDDIATPDDYLNYQIFTPDPNARATNIVYKNSKSVVALALGIGAVATYFAITSEV
jgi:hypothetical protein